MSLYKYIYIAVYNYYGIYVHIPFLFLFVQPHFFLGGGTVITPTFFAVQSYGGQS